MPAEGGVTCTGVSRIRAGIGAGSGLVERKRLAVLRSRRDGGGQRRLESVGGLRSFLTSRFRGPSLMFILPKSSMSSPRSIISRRPIDFAGWRIQIGGGKVYLPSLNGKGSYGQVGG